MSATPKRMKNGNAGEDAREPAAEDEAPSTEEPSPELRLADGIELLGEYRDSGYTQPPYLIQRADGHTIQVSRLVYLVAEALATHHDADSAASDVSRHYGRDVSAENITYLVENKLAPVGVMRTDGSSDEPPVTAKPLLALRLRVPLVPERVHRVVTTGLMPLFWPPVIVAAMVALIFTDAWLLTSQRASIAEGMRMLIFEPKLLLALTALTLVAAVFHEVGHAAAARYGGATPGAMGAGIYIVWPAFYTDVTDTYRLDRRGRLRTDFGGIYFNVLFTLGTVWLFTMTGYTPLLVLAGIVQLETLRQFLPFIRLDGFYVMSDLAGVPNLFLYMKPVLTVLVRRRHGEARTRAKEKLAELTRRSRILIVGWVTVTVPVLAAGLTLFLVLIPRGAGIAWGSVGFQIDSMTTPSGSVTPVGAINGTVNLILLALPVAGMTYILAMLLKRGAKLAARSWPHRPAVTGATGGLAVAGLLLLVGTVWPNTFASALRHTQDVPGQNVPQARARWQDLPTGLNVLAAAPPAATPIPVVMPDDELPPPDGGSTAAPPPPEPNGSTGTGPSAGDGSARQKQRSGSVSAPSTPTPAPDRGSQRPPSPSAQPPAGNGQGDTGGTPPTTAAQPPAGEPEPQPTDPPQEEPTPLQRLARAFGGLLG